MAITKRINVENMDFWKLASVARATIKSWPAWKRNLHVTKYSVGHRQYNNRKETDKA